MLDEVIAIGGGTAVRQTNTTLTNLPNTLSVHLGWHSTALTQHLQKQAEAQPKYNESDDAQADDTPPSHIRANPLLHPSNPPITPPPTIRLYLSLVMAWLKQGLTAPVWVWLLLRHLDKQRVGEGNARSPAM